MTRAAPQTWLEKLEEQCQCGNPVPGTQSLIASTVNVDVDWMDPTYSKTLPIKPNDQTSNNLWVNQQMSHPENKEMVLQVCKEFKSEGWKAAYTRIVS
jgi:transaldolase